MQRLPRTTLKACKLPGLAMCLFPFIQIDTRQVYWLVQRAELASLIGMHPSGLGDDCFVMEHFPVSTVVGVSWLVTGIVLISCSGWVQRQFG